MDEIRSFIAIEVPQALKSRIEELQRELRRTDADVKWVRPEAIHLTLKFLGSIPQEDVEKISRALAPVISAWVPFEVRIHGMGGFPRAGIPGSYGLDLTGEKEKFIPCSRRSKGNWPSCLFPQRTGPSLLT